MDDMTKADIEAALAGAILMPQPGLEGLARYALELQGDLATMESVGARHYELLLEAHSTLTQAKIELAAALERERVLRDELKSWTEEVAIFCTAADGVDKNAPVVEEWAYQFRLALDTLKLFKRRRVKTLAPEEEADGTA